MIPHDLLNGLPAKASTPVAGHWIVRFSGQIQVRKYIVSPRISQDEDHGDPEEKADAVDVLESAWRAVNSQGGPEVADVLSPGCGIVVEEPAPVPSSEEGPTDEQRVQRVLYVFSSGTKAFTLPGVQGEHNRLMYLS